MTTNTALQTDYAFLMLKMEQYQRAMHDACLRKKWQEASNHGMAIQNYLAGLLDWLEEQQDGMDGKFQEVRLPQQEAV